jgi:hypothetical protein
MNPPKLKETRMLRVTALSALLVAAATTTSFATDISDPSGRFTATVPDGWTSMGSLPPPAVFMISKPAADGTRSVCTAVILATPANTSKTQQEIDDEIQRVNTNDVVKATYEMQGFKDVVVEKQASRQGEGHVVHQIMLTLTAQSAGGASTRLKVFEELHALPGQAHDLGCIAKPENYAAVEPDFQAIGLGYKPKSAIVAWARSPVVTLYTDARYSGQSKSVGTDTSDVTSVGWHGQTGSLAIADTSTWQVCEAAGYAGRCMTLNANLPGKANQHFAVGSLRRLETTTQPAIEQIRKTTGQGAFIGSAALAHP